MLIALPRLTEVDTQLTYTVKKRRLKIMFEAKGELIAATETVISTPASSNGPQTLAWIMPEYSQVNKGEQVVARFDGRVMSKQKRESEFLNDKVSQESSGKNAEIDTRRKHYHDIHIVEKEKKFAETFSIDDVMIISKLDILKQTQKVDYLNAKTNYLNWQSEQFNSSAQGELDSLSMQSQQHQSKLTKPMATCHYSKSLLHTMVY